ncbi:MAG: cation transporter [Oscillospiraceae bacterium]|nr:cation transporter [Oscillospiraceae bacterium]
MEKTIKVNGMGCANCAAKVQKALEAIPGVEKAVVSVAGKNAVVTLCADVPVEKLCAAVNATGKYTASAEG